MGYEHISDNISIPDGIEEGFETLVRTDDLGSRTIDLLIEGVHCAACIQKIESLFREDSSIKKVRLNFSTRKLNLVWNGLPEAANDYVRKIKHAGYAVLPFNSSLEKEKTNEEERFLLFCLGVSGFAMGNIMLLSVGLWTTDGETMGMATRDFLHWISALIALPAVAFSGRPFFRSAVKALSKGRTNMDVPISVGVVLACFLSLFETTQHGEHVFFDSAIMLIFFLLIGRYLDFRARKNARSVAIDLLGSLSPFTDVWENGKIRRYPVSELKPEMVVRVSMGEKIPADGVIVQGDSSIDSSLLTGETIPQSVCEGDFVYAGTINLGHSLLIRVSDVGENTVLSDIVRLMEKAEQGQARYVRLADRAARLYTPVVHFFAAATFLVWWLVLGLAWQKSLMIAVSVLIITCPCALALAVPVVQVLATSFLMHRNVLVKSGDALERLATVDTILTDKTGTLTIGKPLLEATDKVFFSIAASLAAHSNHPLSRALVSEYHDSLVFLEEIQEFPGSGLQGVFQGRKIRLGNRSWCGLEESKNSEKMELWFSMEGEEPEVFHFEDCLRSDAREIVSSLKKDGFSLSILSGDRQAVVEKIAMESGIEDFHAMMTPSQKYAFLEERKKEGHKVLMIGDGLNDAPTLVGASVSMAPGTAIDMTQNAADIVLMGESFKPVLIAIRIARRTQMLIRQNFMIAILYNLIAVPMAVMGMVTPFIAALSMSGSSLIVIANSFRVRKEQK